MIPVGHRRLGDCRPGRRCHHRSGHRILHLGRIQTDQGHRRTGQNGPATTIIDGLATGMYSAGIPVITIVIGIHLCLWLCRRLHPKTALAWVCTASALPPSVCWPRWASHWPPMPTVRSPTMPAATPKWPVSPRSARTNRCAGFAGQHDGRHRQGIRHRLGGPDRHGPAGRLHRRDQNLDRQTGRRKRKPVQFTEHDRRSRPKHAEIIGLRDCLRAEHHESAAALRPVHRRHDGLRLLCHDHEGGGPRRRCDGRRSAPPVPGNPGHHGRHGKPDYAKCVAISTAGAQREMLVPSLLAIIVPVLTVWSSACPA